MGCHFKQINEEDRVAICHLLKAGISKAKIAAQLGFHRSSIYREIARNSTNIGYLPIVAKRKFEERQKRSFKLNRDKKLRDYVFEKLQQSWSPEQIAGRLKRNNNGLSIICHETIYAYLYSDYGIRNKYYRYLRRKREWRYPKVSRNQRIKIPNRVMIQERPESIALRKEFGHWEADLMMFNRSTKANLITLRERQSRYMIAIKNPGRYAESTSKNIIKAFGSVSKSIVKTITFDNGNEFAKHEKIAKQIKAQTYFCEPYKSYQKGTIENGNKQLREWFPREIRIELISQQKINHQVKLINQRPMKCLNYCTPWEKFHKQLKFLATIKRAKSNPANSLNLK